MSLNEKYYCLSRVKCDGKKYKTGQEYTGKYAKKLHEDGVVESESDRKKAESEAKKRK